MNNFAPIVIFSYNRSKKIQFLIRTLLKNPESKYSKLYIFQDNFKSEFDKREIIKINLFIKKIKGFLKIKIIKRKKNFGLRKNIVDGVNRVFLIEKKAIFLEDDLTVSKDFLRFMNKCLSFYQHNKKIWSISGWNYNINFNDQNDALLVRYPSSWGWATWSDRWKNYRINPKKILNTWSLKKKIKFNIDNTYNFFSQIIRNNNKTLNSWAIFWYSTIFEANGLCVCAKKSLVTNRGFNNFATNTKKVNRIFTSKKYRLAKSISLPNNLIENKEFIKELKRYLVKDSFFKSIYNFFTEKYF